MTHWRLTLAVAGAILLAGGCQPMEEVGPDGLPTLTKREEDRVRKQIGNCWGPPESAGDGSDPVIEIRVTVGHDRRVESATILEPERTETDENFRAFAESARKAFAHPKCKRLKLPRKKYERWKVIIFRFDLNGQPDRSSTP